MLPDVKLTASETISESKTQRVEGVLTKKRGRSLQHQIQGERA
jgi:hypothetical protein